MSQQQQQPDNFYYNASAGSMQDFENFHFNIPSQQEESEEVKPSASRRDDTNSLFEQLYKGTYIQRPGERMVLRTSGRKNKNEILGLTLALLNKEKYLNGIKYTREMELTRGIQLHSNNGEFVLVLRTDGRIVAMSDEVEYHLGKSMRSLYTQCINIFECLNKADGKQLRTILNFAFDYTHREYRLVCTFRLPKGKRPSRAQEDIKTITMVGHFYSCDDSPTSERLFIARCEALLSRANTSSSSSSTAMTINNNTNSLMELTLNEDMSISMASMNVQDILGYSKNEMIGDWFGKYLTSDDLDKFEAIRMKHFQQEQQSQQAPTSICAVFDMYTNNGDGRLTFLCQIRPVRERRSKVIKYTVLAQMVDPLLRHDYEKYVQSECEINPKATKAEQVNLVSSSISKASEDPIMANSPSLAMGLLMCENTSGSHTECSYQQPHSPLTRSLSNFVGPVDIHDEFGREFIDFDFEQYPTALTDFSNGPNKSFAGCSYDQGISNALDDIDEYLFMNYFG